MAVHGQVEVLIPAGATWKYEDQGVDLGTSWRLPAFDDSAWDSGPAQLGFGDGDEATVLTGQSAVATFYFRHTFNNPGLAGLAGLTVRLRRDDGAIVYLNGIEVFRSNMPGGTVVHTTLASSTAADDGLDWQIMDVNPALLVAGQNQVAVEVHQASVSSSDVTFDLQLESQLVNVTDLLVISDRFEYPAGAIAGLNGGTGFSGGYSGVGTIAAGSLSYTDALGAPLQTSGGSLLTVFNQAIFRNFNLSLIPPPLLDGSGKLGADGTTIYVALLIDLASGTTNVGFGGLSLFDGVTERIFFGDTGWEYATWGVDPQQGQLAVQSSTVPISGTTRLLVGRMDFAAGNETIRMYVDPPLHEEPALASVGPFSMPDFRITRMRLASSTSGNGTHHVDELKFGTSYRAVIPQLTVPTIVVQPGNRTVTAGGGTVFSVGAQGNPAPSFQWRHNGVPIPGATQPLLPLGDITPSQAGIYTVVVSNLMGSTISLPATLTVNSPALITSHPIDQTVRLGATAVFRATATGTAPLAYQWQFNNFDILGATTDTLTLNNAQLSNNGNYRVRVSNALGAVFSNNAELSVLDPPAIVVPPVPVSVPVNDAARLCVDASGTLPLLIQWRKNGVNIPGATSTCLVLESVAPSDAGSYSVVVANEVGLITAGPVTLEVQIHTLLAGDNFKDRVTLDGNLLRGSNVGATKEPGEPDHAGNPGGHSVWYTQRADVDGIVTVRTSGSSFDTLLAVYVGNDFATFTLVASDEDQAGYFASEVRFNALRGTQYHIAVDGFDGDEGAYTLTWELEPTLQRLPVIVQAPISRTTLRDASVTFTVNALGGFLTYQWYFNGAPILGANGPSYTLLKVEPAHVGYYAVRITNDSGRSILSAAALLEISSVAGAHSQDKVSNPSFSGALHALTGSTGTKGGPGRVAVTGAGGILVGAGVTGYQILNNTNALIQRGEPNHCGVLGGATRWLVLQPAEDGLELGLDTAGSQVATVLAAYARSSILEPLTEVDCGTGLGNQNAVRFPAFAAQQYWIAVDGVAGAQGIIQLNWSLGHPPQIIATPPDQVAPLDSSVRWSVASATPVPAPNYQWYVDGQPIEGATSAFLALNNILPQRAGIYAVAVSNPLGSIVQSMGRLIVDATTVARIQSRFESGPEGWTIEDSSAALLPIHQPGGGAADGFILHADGGGAAIWHWQAAALYAGNRSDLYNGRLEFKMTKTPTLTSLGATEPDVIVKGRGKRMVYAGLADPGPQWTAFSVPLHEAAGWHLDHTQGPVPTRSEMLAILGDTEQWLIRGHFSLEPHTVALDDVRLIAPVQSDVAWMKARWAPSGQVILEWPQSAGRFQLESAAHPLTAAWTPLSLIPANMSGFRRVTIVPPPAERYYRLHAP